MATHIDYGVLGPPFLTDLPQCRKVVSNLIELTGNQGVGFEIDDEAKFIELGIVGHAIFSPKNNSRDAVTLWTRWCSKSIGMMVDFSLAERRADDWSLRIAESVPGASCTPFARPEVVGRPAAMPYRELAVIWVSMALQLVSKVV